MSDPKTDPKADAEAKAKADAEAKAKAAPRTIKEGDEVMMTAVYGLIINPHTQQRLEPGEYKKVKVDRWTIVQFEAGKLALE